MDHDNKKLIAYIDGMMTILRNLRKGSTEFADAMTDGIEAFTKAKAEATNQPPNPNHQQKGKTNGPSNTKTRTTHRRTPTIPHGPPTRTC